MSQNAFTLSSGNHFFYKPKCSVKGTQGKGEVNMLDIDLLVNTGASVILSCLMDELARMQAKLRPADPADWIRQQLLAKRYFMTCETFRLLLDHAKLAIARGSVAFPAVEDSASSPLLPPLLELVMDSLRDLSTHFHETARQDMWTDDVSVEFSTSLADIFSSLSTTTIGAYSAASSTESGIKRSLVTLRLFHDHCNAPLQQHQPTSGSLFGAVVRLAMHILQCRCLRCCFDHQLQQQSPSDSSAPPLVVFPLSSLQIVLPVVPDVDGVASSCLSIDQYVADVLRVSTAILKASTLDDTVSVKVTLTGPSCRAAADGPLGKMTGERTAASRLFLNLRSHEPCPVVDTSASISAGEPSSLLKLLDPITAIGMILADATHPRHNDFAHRVAVVTDPLIDIAKRSSSVLQPHADGKARCSSFICSTISSSLTDHQHLSCGGGGPAQPLPIVLILPLFGNVGGVSPSFSSFCGSAVASLLTSIFLSWRPSGSSNAPSGAPDTASKKPKKDAQPNADQPPQQKKEAAANTTGGAAAAAPSNQTAQALIGEHPTYFPVDDVSDSCFVAVLCQNPAPLEKSPGPGNMSNHGVATLALAGVDSSAASDAAAQLAGIALIPKSSASSGSTCWCKALSVTYVSPSAWCYLRDAPLPFIALQLATQASRRNGTPLDDVTHVSMCASQRDSLLTNTSNSSSASHPLTTASAVAFIRSLTLLTKLCTDGVSTESPTRGERGEGRDALSGSTGEDRGTEANVALQLRLSIVNLLTTIAGNGNKSIAAATALQKLAAGKDDRVHSLLKRIRQALAAV